MNIRRLLVPFLALALVAAAFTAAPLADTSKPESRTAWTPVPRDLLSLEADPLKASSDPGFYGRKYSFKGDAAVETPCLVALFCSAKGRVVLCQATPWMFDYAKKPYLRTTYRRNLFLVSRLLANLGAPSATPLLDRVRNPAPLTGVDLVAGWVGEVDRNDAGRDRNWWQPEFADSAWKPIDVPGCFDVQRAELKEHNGLFWYRLRFKVPAGLSRIGLRLNVGPVDDESWVWLNGRFLGEVTKKTNPDDYWKAPREYALDPAGLNWDSENVLAVRVNDTYQTGGLTGMPRLAARPAWLDSYYLQTPVADDDPHRYYRW